jgi:hypothetical protein
MTARQSMIRKSLPRTWIAGWKPAFRKIMLNQRHEITVRSSRIVISVVFHNWLAMEGTNRGKYRAGNFPIWLFLIFTSRAERRLAGDNDKDLLQ